MYLLNKQLRKKWLDQCLKSCVSEETLTDNVGNGSKHCCNLNDSSLTLLLHQCEGNYVGKSLFQ